jgi:hypothetical protein
MSQQIPTDNDDNRSVAASDFVQFDQPDEVTDQEVQQQRFGLHQNPLDWTLETGGSTNNYGNDLKEQKLLMMIATLEVRIIYRHCYIFYYLYINSINHL